jgi:23S rRNA pseudouridine1911/1915/1917 synthase
MVETSTKIKVACECDQQRLDVFLAEFFGRSRNNVRTKLKGKVRSAEGRLLKWSHRLRVNEIISVVKIQRPEPNVPVSYKILYQDQSIVVVDKGAGAPVHPARSFKTQTILTKLQEDLQDSQLWPVHRLDRETSGVLVFGRNKQVVTQLMKQFSSRTVRKRYLAIVDGRPSFTKICCRAPLARDLDFPIKCRMRVDHEKGQPAVTDFKLADCFRYHSLVAAILHTGRQHQIRVHLAHLGYPIVGDKLYRESGRPYLAMINNGLTDEDLSVLGHHRQALHAECLEFMHPISNKRLEIHADLPDDLVKLTTCQIPCP